MLKNDKKMLTINLAFFVSMEMFPDMISVEELSKLLEEVWKSWEYIWTFVYHLDLRNEEG